MNQAKSERELQEREIIIALWTSRHEFWKGEREMMMMMKMK